ncbi:BRO1 domain-containing protein [Forsythia ovata]|uniref:BRO1 domain-containing protein n=1 Tax=Forsythia ovata TaxID=205694 RepID=A0ABD1W3I4_9LAMI
MGCAISISAVGKKGKNMKKSIQKVTVFVPSLRVPFQSDLQKRLGGLIPKDLVDRISSLRNQIVLVAEDIAISELQKALEDYLSLLLGLTNKKVLPLVPSFPSLHPNPYDFQTKICRYFENKLHRFDNGGFFSVGAFSLYMVRKSRRIKVIHILLKKERN